MRYETTTTRSMFAVTEFETYLIEIGRQRLRRHFLEMIDDVTLRLISTDLFVARNVLFVNVEILLIHFA